MSRSTLSLIALIAGSAISAAAVAGDPVCSVYRLNIPDFDQRRTPFGDIPGLPGNGNSHCVPTAAVNWLAYVANKGYPEAMLPVGPQNWQSNDHYNEVTLTIHNIGDIMGTSTSGGTSYGLQRDVLQVWLDIEYPGMFTVSAKSNKGENFVSIQQMTDTMRSGGMLCFGTQRWQPRPAETILDDGIFYNMPARYVHAPGGHMVTVSRIYDACSNTPTIFFRDPADDTLSLWTQSDFKDKAITLTRANALYASGLTGTPVQRLQYIISCGTTCSMIHFYSVIKATYAITADLHDGKITFKGTTSLDLTDLPDTDVDLPGNLQVASFEIEPMLGSAAIVARDPATGQHSLWTLTLPDHRWTHLGNLSGASPIAFSPWGELIFHSDGALHSLNLSDTTPSTTGAIPMAEAPSALAFDDDSDTVYLLVPAIQKVRAAAARMSTGAVDMDLPAGITITPDTCVALSPDGSSIWMCSPTGNEIQRLAIGGAGSGLVLADRIAHPSIVAPSNLQIDHRGTVLFTSNGAAQALKLNPANGQWETATTTKFAGSAVGDLFRISQSRSGKDDFSGLPDQFADTGELDGMTIPDCFADFNADGTVNVPDIFAFLAAWFAQHPAADVDANLTIAVPDIFTFLSAWFAGC